MMALYKFLPHFSFFFCALSAICAWKEMKKLTTIFLAIFFLVMVFHLAGLWVSLERPPMRTLGETRLWYAFFLPLVGVLLYRQLKSPWVLLYSQVMAGLFLLLNILKPENFDKTLMPALQSPWFVPHVIVYMIAYALLGLSALFACYQLYQHYFRGKQLLQADLDSIDLYVVSGTVLLTLGLLFGALWAKEAWGHYWTWDPKETWALITWLVYLNYLHAKSHQINESLRVRRSLFFVAIGFVAVLLCWFGVNYMPSAQNSVHTYTN